MKTKVSDIKMMEQDGTFQMAIGNHCVTDYNFKTADACYKHYIAYLLTGINKAEQALPKNTGW